MAIRGRLCALGLAILLNGVPAPECWDLPEKMPTIIAHRGGRYWEGGDFSYIEDAVREGASGVEVDVRRRGTAYIVQHDGPDSYQGTLEDALARIGSADVYLDLKEDLYLPDLIDFVKPRVEGRIFVGSFDQDVLAGIEDPSVGRIYQCVQPFCSLEGAGHADADWINPVPFLITEDFVREAKAAGFAITPGGNPFDAGSETFRTPLRHAELGADAVSVYDVAAFIAAYDAAR